MTQLSILDALDAAGAHPQAVRPPEFEWLDTWQPGDVIPPGFAPPVPGVDTLPFRYCYNGGDYDAEIAADLWQAIYAELPLEIPLPFCAMTETCRLPDGTTWCCLEAAIDGGVSHVALRNGVLEWEDAPGAGPLIWREDTHTWVRLPSKDMWDAEAQAWVPKASALEATSAHPDVEATETALAEAEPVSGGPAAFLHAHNLASDIGWKALAGSLDRTTPGDVRTAAARHVASGTLSLANATALLACIEDTEENAAPEHEGDEPDAPPDPAEFLATIWLRQELNRAAKGVKWCPLRALIDAGLARQIGQRVVLLPPASEVLEMRHRARPGRIARLDFTLREGVDPASEIVRRVEELARIGVDPDAPLILTRGQARPRTEGDHDVVA